MRHALKIVSGSIRQPKPVKENTLRRGLTSPEDSSLVEILDRVLDHGITVEPSSRVRLIGMELLKSHERLVIDWKDTYF